MQNVDLSKRNGQMIIFFVEVKGKPVCLVCGDALAVMKKANLERHYSSKNAKLNELGGQMRLDKINALQRSLKYNKPLSLDLVVTETTLFRRVM
jgi:hypothetical protein